MLGESLVKLGTLVVLKQMGEHRESAELTGGGGGIRTHETLSGLTVFKRTKLNSSVYLYIALECFRRAFWKITIAWYCPRHPSFCPHSRHSGVTQDR